MAEVLELQEMATEMGADEEGVIADSSASLFECGSDYSIFVC